jgi:hypothetical protein
MSFAPVTAPYATFVDINGQPLEDGYVWIGVLGLEPQANPLAAYWDSALTQAVTQPVRTRGGYPLNGSAIGKLHTAARCSVKVQNKNGSTVVLDLTGQGGLIASQAEAEAGTDNTKSMTALRSTQQNSYQFGRTVANEAAMLALAGAIVGSEVYRTDTATYWKLRALPAATLGNWTQLAAGGGGGGGGGGGYLASQAPSERARLPALIGGRLYRLPADTNPSGDGSTSAQIVHGVNAGMVIESIYCVTAGTGALNLHDSTNGSLNAAERIHSIASPAANTLYTLDKPLRVERRLMGGQTTLGSFLICAREYDGGDAPRNSSVAVTSVDASGVVLNGAGWFDSIQVVAPGSAGNLVVYAGQFQDADTPTLLSIAFGSLSAGQVIRLGAGLVRVPGLSIAITTGGQFNVRTQPFYRE